MDNNLIVRSHTVATVRFYFAALHRICSVRRSLMPEALLTLVHALVVSNVDYCNSVVAGVSAHLQDRLQPMLMLMLSRSSWQGSLSTSAPYSVNFTSCVFQREFNCCCVLVLRCLHGTVPSYLADYPCRAADVKSSFC